MEIVKEFLILFGRVITILPLLLLVTLFMGKRSVGELPIFDFIIFLALGSVVGADLADPDISHIHTAVAIVLIGALQKVVAIWKVKNRKLGKALTFEPTVVINEGKIVVKNLERINYTIDNVLMMLREKEVFDTSIVKMAIIEANGNLSVLKKPSKSTVTMEDINIANKQADFAYPVIVEGEIYTDVLKDLKLDKTWLIGELKKLSIIDAEKVFFAAVDLSNKLHVSLKSEDLKGHPRLYH
ncbi:DUF421 domain-containing protein [Virgibacillus sp. C22-A2]|uniref:DUF421 domain-containing protein n=1 Tax=Virgibacillus tibetensis TaxID=3042313 RepID=A0ABU6KEQ1_9BACI|nr:DUF421 domain-containing protein [Virgibacillus sp. C22-A2]